MSITVPMLSVYDGQVCIGWVLERGRAGFEAFSDREQSLGVFATRDGAINKIQSTANARASVA